MVGVQGSQGYEQSVRKFVELSQSLRFEEVCKDFLNFLPDPPSRILDAGSGAGQNAAALAELGYSVVAIEPMGEFLEAARVAYSQYDVLWLEDSLPGLGRIPPEEASFEFILVDGVWHHLDEEERSRSLERFWNLLDVGGKCALSLRNGPPGLGTCVYPTDFMATLRDSKRAGFECVFVLEGQPSILEGKEDVVWCRLVLEKVT